jgi:hypothetical protein
MKIVIAWIRTDYSRVKMGNITPCYIPLKREIYLDITFHASKTEITDVLNLASRNMKGKLLLKFDCALNPPKTTSC